MYGLLDMAGNVWEWVQDFYDENYYRRSPARNPAGPDTGSGGVVRGGSWRANQYGLRGSDRDWFYHVVRHVGIGFRCVREIPEK